MPIVEIPGAPGPVDPIKGKQDQHGTKGKVPPKTSQDRAEVSEEARALLEADRTKRFEVIREKIRQGFYFQRDVTEKVIDALLKDLKKR
jgi:anti-sigma28 factor (negative regulator of flagellin synthesis)